MKTKNAHTPKLRRLGGGGRTSAPILSILERIDAKVDEILGYTRPRLSDTFTLSDGKRRQIDEALRRLDIGVCASVTDAARYSLTLPCKDGYTSIEPLRGALRRRLAARWEAKKRFASVGRNSTLNR